MIKKNGEPDGKADRLFLEQVEMGWGQVERGEFIDSMIFDDSFDFRALRGFLDMSDRGTGRNRNRYPSPAVVDQLPSYIITGRQV